MRRYNPKDIEPKWQKKWEAEQIYAAGEDPAKPKRYVLEYFPYPSGSAMHVGHVRNYTIGDATARFYRMQGYNVMHPMGWDAFGLPAENYAIKHNISPKQAIKENTGKFKQQLTQMGFSYDWNREIDSSDPGYYKWTQWFFKLLLERGLAYQKDSLQWWCETDKTVLANEQVEAGKCWRCGNEVTKKPLKQWFFKITDYADRLVADLDKLDWSDAIKSMQRNWIGRSVGAEVRFDIKDSSHELTVFTTRPDTLFGATFMVVAPEHPLVSQITSKDKKNEVDAYIKSTQAKSDIERQEENREKTGIFTGAYAINPVNNKEVPIWVADYVLYGYGTGAIMAVPAHDDRDYEFAQKFNLPIVPVVRPDSDKAVSYIMGAQNITEADIQKLGGTVIETSDKGHLFVEFPKAAVEAYEQLIREKMENGFWNEYIADQVIFTFKDRSGEVDRYVLDDESHDIIRRRGNEFNDVPNGDDSVWSWLGGNRSYGAYFLDNKEGIMINSGIYDGLTSQEARERITQDLAKKHSGKERVNYKIRDWLISRQRYWGAPIPVIHCQKDGAVAVPDDQLPVELPDVKSYQPTGEGKSVLASVDDWVNVTCPKCGGPAKRETDTMDGFACSSWYFLRFADPHNTRVAFDAEKAKFWLPVDDYIGGAEHAVMHLLYARFWTKVMYDAGLISFDEPFTSLRNQGMILAPDGRKMSKSWGNVIAPDELIDQGYGADSIRIMELFIGPWNQQANWSVEGMGGAFRFLQRTWTLVQEFLAADQTGSSNEKLERAAHSATKRVTKDMHDMGFNTAIASLMEYVNELYKTKAEEAYSSSSWQEALERLVLLLAPFAPHITEELWAQLGNEGSVHVQSWPGWDEAKLQASELQLVVQVNGKLRGKVEVGTDATKEDILQVAKQDAKVAEHLEGKKITREIYVPGKLVNFVVI